MLLHLVSSQPMSVCLKQQRGHGPCKCGREVLQFCNLPDTLEALGVKTPCQSMAQNPTKQQDSPSCVQPECLNPLQHLRLAEQSQDWGRLPCGRSDFNHSGHPESFPQEDLTVPLS